MHCSTPFYTRGLSTNQFRYLRGPGTSSLQILKDDRVFGESESYHGFLATEDRFGASDPLHYSGVNIGHALFPPHGQGLPIRNVPNL